MECLLKYFNPQFDRDYFQLNWIELSAQWPSFYELYVEMLRHYQGVSCFPCKLDPLYLYVKYRRASALQL